MNEANKVVIEDLKNTKIENTGYLVAHTALALKRHGINTVGELVALGRTGTMALRGVGGRDMTQVQNFLKSLDVLGGHLFEEWEEK